MSQFQQSPRFAEFKKEFLAHIEYIKRFAMEHLGDAAHEVYAVFHNFGTRVFDTKYAYFAGQEATVYGEGKRSLEQFCAQLEDEGIDLAHRQTCVRQLADGIQNCVSGMAINLAVATQSLQQMKGDQFRRIRNEVAIALITEAYRQLTAGSKPVTFTIYLDDTIVDHIPGDYEIHYGTFLRNALAESLGLEKVVDALPQSCRLSDEAVDYCRQYVLQRLTPARLAMVLAEEYVDAFRRPVVEALEKAGADGAAGQSRRRDHHAPIDYEQWRRQLDDARDLLKTYGDINMYSLITPETDYPNVRLNVDPTLVAVDILREQQSIGFVAPSYLPETVLDWRHGEKRICINHLADELAWAVENDVARVLNTKHLLLLLPKDFAGRENVAKRIVANVIRNSPPETLRANLSLEWLSISETASVFSKWTPDALSHYLNRHAMHMAILPRLRKLSIAKGVVACGSVADLGLCVTHGRTLFEPPRFEPPRIAVHPPAFFAIALLRGDPLMFGALVNRLEEGMAVSRKIKEQLPAILASADEDGVPALYHLFCRSKPNPLLSDYYRLIVQAANSLLLTPGQLTSILAARNARETPALTVLMKNNDHEKIKEFGAILIDMNTQGWLGSSHFANLLSAPSANRVPAFLYAVNTGNAAAIAAFGDILVAAHGKAIHDCARVYALLAVEIWGEWSALRYAADKGRRASVEAIGKVMEIAIKKKALRNEHIYKLLHGTATAKHLVLETALLANETETATAIGNLLLNCYEDGVIERDQICRLLCAKTKESMQYMLESAPSTLMDGGAINTLGNLILIADTLRLKKEGPESLPLSAPEECRIALPASLARACSKAGLELLAANLRKLHGRLEARQLSLPQIVAHGCILELFLQRSRLALFFTADDVRDRINIYVDIQREWEGMAEFFESENAARRIQIG